MFNYFFRFYNKAVANDLFNRDAQDGTTSPPDSEQRITEDSNPRTTQNSILRITE
jgi:hypothetical protein